MKLSALINNNKERMTAELESARQLSMLLGTGNLGCCLDNDTGITEYDSCKDYRLLNSKDGAGRVNWVVIHRHSENKIGRLNITPYVRKLVTDSDIDVISVSKSKYASYESKMNICSNKKVSVGELIIEDGVKVSGLDIGIKPKFIGDVAIKTIDISNCDSKWLYIARLNNSPDVIKARDDMYVYELGNGYIHKLSIEDCEIMGSSKLKEGYSCLATKKMYSDNIEFKIYDKQNTIEIRKVCYDSKEWRNYCAYARAFFTQQTGIQVEVAE